MSRTVVRQTRPADYIYDPVYTVSGDGPVSFKAARAAAKSFTATAQPQAVLGTERPKFFKRPLVPFLQSVPPEVLFAPVRDTNVNPLEAPPAEPAPTKKTVSVQTMYRESEAQTDPYTPDYIIHPNSKEPEVLTLTNLKYGQGLPASLDEVQAIERARKKREFEASLPPFTDPASFELRKKLMQEQELREWAEREIEIDRAQEERIELVRHALMERDKRLHALQEVRVEQLRQKKMEERDIAIDEIQKRRIKALRVLSKKRQQIEPTIRERDIVSEYANHGSNVYAPVARGGKVPHPEVKNVDDIPLLATMEGLQTLTNSLPRPLLEARVKPPSSASASKSFAARKSQAVAADLEKLDQQIRLEKTQGDRPTETHVNVYKKMESMLRPATPSVDASNDDDDEAAIVLLQRLLRGRAQQNLMYEGKEHRLNLIRELRISEEEQIQNQSVEHTFPGSKELLVDSTIDFLTGFVIGQQLDFLSKELVRLNQERYLSHLMVTAENARRVRESEESGRRQAEYLVRKAEEEQYKAVVVSALSSSDALIDKLISSTTTAYATETAAIMQDIQDNVLSPLESQVEQTLAAEEAAALEALKQAQLAAEAAEKQRLAEEAAQAEQARIAAEEAAAQIVNEDILPAVEAEIERRQTEEAEAVESADVNNDESAESAEPSAEVPAADSTQDAEESS